MPVFDKYAENYDEGHVKAVAMSGFKPSYFHEYKLKEMVNFLKAEGYADKPLKLLDFGCGTGSSVKYIRKYLPKIAIWGTDVSTESIKVAKRNNRGVKNVTFAPFDGEHIPFKEKFDIIFIANVFHHIRRDKHDKVIKNIYKNLTKDGHLFIFELNPINPLTMLVAIKNDYRFDKDANLLNPFYAKKMLQEAGFIRNKVRYTIFIPRFISFLLPLEKYLYRVPLGAHYYYVAKKTS
ncbi:MAG TPA: class I SAM-dependent methyltransferase [Candidatus Sulfotelmatobacter sp.]|jgi:SAM-dependent methyltransferase|nr:class I SAM-dependent methyltransferase [Candidatus Sulfotelmatobacter sp.]